MAVKKKFNSLGRGLDALIPNDEVRPQGSSTISEIALDQIEANPGQPRQDFDTESLQELANSIREIGIVQPITLRQVSNERYQIIAGERRWRASQMAGLSTIPAYIRTIDDESVMEMALVENIQREDLNAIEIALAYSHLMENAGMTQEKVAERVGKSRVAVANYLRLLKLPAQVQMALQQRTIDMGHARALLSLDDPSQQLAVFELIKKNGLSVRQVEETVKKVKNGEEPGVEKGASKSGKRLPEEFDILRQQLAGLFGQKLSLHISPSGKGKISIPFANEEELEHIMSLFDRLKRN